MDLSYQCLGAFIAIIGFSLVMNVPKSYLIVNGGIGAAGWFVYLAMKHTSGSEIISTFAGAVIISLLSHIAARIKKAPVTMFLIPANMTLVPGAGMYHTVYHIIHPEGNLASEYLQQTILAAVMIAIAMFIVEITVGIITKNKARKEG